MSSQFGLLKARRFGPFFATQFLGAFNDNLFKNALVVLLTFQAASWTTIRPEVLTNLAAGVFILPFFLFSATAGQLADKYDKARLARLVKLLEVLIMGVALLGFAIHSLPILFAALFLLGLHSTLFGPVKYAILPQHLRESELVGGNALVEAGTFVAILIGTLAGGLLAGAAHQPTWVAIAGLLIAVLGYICSRGIPAAAAPAPQLVVSLNPFSETWRNIGFARSNRAVFLSILGISWFWLYGAMFLAQFPAYARFVLGGDETSVTLLLAVFTVGIGVGSLLCERLSAGQVEIGLVPFGSIGLTLFGIDIAFASPALLPAGAPLSLAALLALPATWRVLLDLFALGLFGGFFIVPLYALIQLRSAVDQRARIIAANNILNALFMVVGSLAAALLLGDGLTIAALFGVAALCNAAVAVYIYSLVPEFMLRFVAWLLIHSFYRLRQTGIENIPEEGPAVLISNHVSFVDPLVIAAASRRPIRFVMDHRIYRLPLIGFVFRHMHAIPIAPAREDAAMMEAAFEEVAQALAAGELVAIFPEGRITDTGELYPFRPGVQRIVGRTPVPVIPMALQGLWGSFFSRKDGPAMSRPLRRGIFSRIALNVGTPVAPAAATPEHLQQIVAGLRGDWR
ncbi:MFS transporter [Accumulibacter sp.]|uniref:MFS transporter n=1 Tax=Accumulibacter sp. TaxID=2053492 RepID=UPI0025E1E6EF|nr:MFS transporter [Accumulibacter sp.]MCM8613775.1 MFS transporter [Accumulibacter sp.]MCM8637441.1 MFS transporter [Accumulibacter sp.]MCM8641508.1 MFS transporter [Accumulibacter sp.]